MVCLYRSFRQYIANNPSARWDVCHDFLYNVHLRGAQGGQKCFSWGGGGGLGHFSNACPRRSLPVREFTGASGVTNITILSNVPSRLLNSKTKYLSSIPDSSHPFPSAISSPMISFVLSLFLQGYSPELTKFLVSGFYRGIQGGFYFDGCTSKNNLSVAQNIEDVFVAIAKELSRRYTSGTFSSSPFVQFLCSPRRQLSLY